MASTTSYPPGYLEESRSGPLVRVSIAFIVLEIIFVGLFIASNIQRKTRAGLDAYLIPLALPFCLASAVCALLAVKYGGLGRHMAYVESYHPNDFIVWLKLQTALVFVNPSAVNLSRLGLLCLYLRLFKVSNYRWVAYGVIIIIVVNWVVLQSILFAMCIPFQYNWDKKIKGGHCIDQQMFFRWATVPNIVTDLVMFFLPMPAVWGLHLPTSQKIGVTFTFFLGSVGVFTAIFRLREFIRLHAFKDLTWYSVDTYTWTVIETGVYLIATCLPSLRSLIKPVLKDLDIRSIRSLFGEDSTNQQKGSSKTEVNSNIAPFNRLGVLSEPGLSDDNAYPFVPNWCSTTSEEATSKNEAASYTHEVQLDNFLTSALDGSESSEAQVEKRHVR